MSQQKYSISRCLRISLVGNGRVSLVGEKDAYAIADAWLLSLVARLYSKSSFSIEEFKRFLAEVEPSADFQLTFTSLLSAGFIADSDIDDKQSHYSQVEFPWDEHGWSTARIFHESVLDTSFIKGDPEGWLGQIQFSKSFSADGDGPPIRKSYENKPRSILKTPKTDNRKSFVDVIENRRTCRRFDCNTKISGDDLGSILHYSARAKRIVKNRYFGDHILRTSPSGGARHPIEIYPQVLNSNDIENGSYYYDPTSHELVLLSSVENQLIYEIGQNQSGCKNVPVAFLVSVRFARNLWKYRYSKSYMFSLFDVGHFVQTLLLCIHAMGYKSFLTPAIEVHSATKHLQLNDSFDECPVYLVTAGKGL